MTHEARELSIWTPRPAAPEVDYAHQRGLVRARAREMGVFNSLGVNAVRTHRTSVVGKSFKLALRPDADFLELDPKAVRQWVRTVEREWEAYANSPNFVCDAEGQKTWTWLMHQVYSTFILSGETVGIVEYNEDAEKWEPKTCLKVIEPERLSQPYGEPPRANFREGVEMNRLGAPIAYHIREAHPVDSVVDASLRSMRWKRIKRRTSWGRVNVLHMMDPIRPGLIRGLSPFVAALRQMKMLDMYNAAELEAAIVQAGFAAVIKTELHKPDAMGVLGAVPTNSISGMKTPRPAEESLSYLNAIAPYHQELALTVNGAKVVHLLPGESLEAVKPQHPGLSFEPFSRQIAQTLAAGLGVSYEQLTRDFSKVTFASAKMSLGDVWRHFMCCRDLLIRAFALPFFFAWLEEQLVKEWLPLPDGRVGSGDDMPMLIRALAGNSSFISWGMPQVDPVKEVKAQALAIDARLTSITDEVTGAGKDFEDLADTIAREREYLEELGIPLPEELAQAGFSETSGEDVGEGFASE